MRRTTDPLDSLAVISVTLPVRNAPAADDPPRPPAPKSATPGFVVCTRGYSDGERYARKAGEKSCPNLARPAQSGPVHVHLPLHCPTALGNMVLAHVQARRGLAA